MNKPINLNKVRKAKTRADEKARADQNAAAFGRTKAERMLAAAQSEKMRAAWDAHRFEEE